MQNHKCCNQWKPGAGRLSVKEIHDAENSPSHIGRVIRDSDHRAWSPLVHEFEISMAGVIVPVWVSYPGVLVAAALITWMVMAAWRS